MKVRQNLPLLMSLLSVGFACSKPAPSATAQQEAAPPVEAAGAAPPELSARVVITGAPINKQQAETMGLQFAAKRWPQYHPRFAEALHEPRDWRVLVQFQEPGVGGMVIYDLYGALLDAGTSTGQH